MNPVILIYNAQMFFRNFGVRHATAALGEFAIGLAGVKAGRMIITIRNTFPMTLIRGR